MSKQFPRAVLAAAIAALTLAACDRQDMDRADRAGAEVGAKADAALDKTKDALKDAGHRAGDAISDAGHRLDAAVTPDKHADNDVREKLADNDVGDKLADKGDKAEDKMHDAGRDAREAISDAAITAAVKTELLKDPNVSALKIDVDTRDGVVTLKGQADSDAARSRAEQIAQQAKGVREVKNRLVVKQA
jgi:osmotically-inducible protein OsmY